VGYQFQHPQRLADWENAHPQFAQQLFDWCTQFLANPFDPLLERRQHHNRSGDAVPNTFHYVVPGVPIPLVITVEKARQERGDDPKQIGDPQGLEVDDGIRMARILNPRSPYDEIPPNRMA
jgi:hypothetical protein